MSSLHGWRVVQYDTVDSTQRIAASLVSMGIPGRTAVIAARQTAGVGRKGDPWHDLPGASLLCTAILRPPWPRPAPIACYGMTAALAVIEAIDDVSGGKAAIKWPNDVTINGRKVAGILGDATWMGQELQALRLGVGVNVRGTREAFIANGLPDATSIEAETGQRATVEDTLRAYLAHLAVWDDLLTGGDRRGVVEAWRAAVATVGQAVRVTLTNGRELGGIVAGVAESGDLLLDLPGERALLSLAASAMRSLRSL